MDDFRCSSPQARHPQIFTCVRIKTQAKAQVTVPSVVNVVGNVSCTVNGNVVVNGTIPIPPFPNALVTLSCNGTVRDVGITSTNGTFSILASTTNLTNNITALLRDCRAVVATPLSICNATLPSTGTLQAPLQNLGNTLIETLVNVTNIAALPFQLV
ncbi:phylloplanin-like [Bidens hawaiensis]|uniref:phylloplanin-like n=1 Tax=Bidens hawaiensis TaxID=980011 RepID=UPI0040496A0C